MAEKNGEIIGSGRSIPEVNLIESLKEVSEYLAKFGGHPGAAGFTLKSPEILEDFKKALGDVISKKLKGLDLYPKVLIDAEVDLEQIDWDFYGKLENFEPFGEKNSRPKFLVKKATVSAIEPMGKEGKHLKMFIQHKNSSVKKMIGFFMGEWAEKLKSGDFVDVIFEVGVNEWNGNRELQLKIVDLRKAV